MKTTTKCVYDDRSVDWRRKQWIIISIHVAPPSVWHHSQYQQQVGRGMGRCSDEPRVTRAMSGMDKSVALSQGSLVLC